MKQQPEAAQGEENAGMAVVPLASKRSVLIMRVFTALFWFTNALTLPYASTFAKELGADNFVAGIIVSAYSVAPIFIRWMIGIVADKLRLRRIFVIGGALLLFLSMSLIFFSGSIPGLFIGRLGQGIAASTWVCTTVLYSSYFLPKDSVNAMGQLNACNSLGNLTGYFLGGLVSNHFGLRSIYLLALVGGLLGTLLSLLITETAAEPVLPSKQEILLAVKARYLLLIGFFALIGQFIQGSTNWGFTAQLATSLGGNTMQIAFCSLSYTIPGLVVSVLVLPRLIRRFGQKRTAILTSTAAAIFCILLPTSQNLPMLYFLCFLLGTAHNLNYALLMGLAIIYFPEKIRAVAMGIMQSIYSLGLLLGPLLAGYVSEYVSLKAAFVVIGVVALLSPLAALTLYGPAERSTKEMLLCEAGDFAQQNDRK